MLEKTLSMSRNKSSRCIVYNTSLNTIYTMGYNVLPDIEFIQLHYNNPWEFTVVLKTILINFYLYFFKNLTQCL